MGTKRVADKYKIGVYTHNSIFFFFFSFPQEPMTIRLKHIKLFIPLTDDISDNCRPSLRLIFATHLNTMTSSSLMVSSIFISVPVHQNIAWN